MILHRARTIQDWAIGAILGLIAAATVIQIVAGIFISEQAQSVLKLVALCEQTLVTAVIFIVAGRAGGAIRRTWLLQGSATAMLALQSALAIFADPLAGVLQQAQPLAALVFSLLFCGLIAAGLSQAPAQPLTGRKRLVMLLDGLMVALASGLIWRTLLIESHGAQLATIEPSTHNQIVAILAGALVVLWVALLALLRGFAGDSTTFQILAVSAALSAIGNALWQAETVSLGTGATGASLAGIGLFGCAVAAGLAGRRDAARPWVVAPPRIQWALYLPLICTQLAFVTLIVYASDAGPAIEVKTFLDLSVGVAIVIGLMLLRVGITLRDNYQLSIQMAQIAQRHQQNAEALRALKQELEQRVEERTLQLRQVNDTLKQEIDERRQAQSKVEEQRAFLQQVIDLNPNHIFAKDSEGRFTLVNRALAEAKGYKVEDMLGKTEFDLNPAQPIINRQNHDNDEIFRTQRDKIIQEEMMLDRFGQPAWFYTVRRPILSADGNVRQVLGVSVDITHRKQMEDQLRRNEQRLRMITDNMLDLVTQISQDWVVVYASPSHYITLGYPPQALLGKSILEFVHPDEVASIKANLTQLLIERQPASRRVRIRHADGRWVWMEAIAKTLRDEQGETMGLIISARDITATIEAEAALKKVNEELAQAYQSTLEGWMRVLDLRDKSTEGHSQRVSELTVRVAQAMHVAEDQLIDIRRGALLHDIGKMGVPDAILRKPGPLNEQEMDIMRRHVDYARDILWPIPYLRAALDIPYCHHERWDGSGYPRGLRGEEIPLAARIFAVVDVWDALVSQRPYRAAWSTHQALNYIRAGAGSAFDPRVVEVFVDLCERGEITDPVTAEDGRARTCLSIAPDTIHPD